MNEFLTRRRLAAKVSAAIPAMFMPPSFGLAGDRAVSTATLTVGDLTATFRDNSQSPKILSGVDSLFHRATPQFNAFDPDSKDASAGLNFEHIICGHKNRNNAFTPRHGKYDLFVETHSKSATLVRNRTDDPWAISSRLKYTLAPPHAIDVDFRCVPHDSGVFGERGYAILFFANYMNDVADAALHFRGIAGPGQTERWIAADAPKTHADWNQGGTYRHVNAGSLEYDPNHNFKLNSWSYDYPRFTKPFYFGRAANGMVFQLMFNKTHTVDDEIRFSLFKFKLRRFPRPAWDFQYVLRRIDAGREYGFKARLIWKKFVSVEDCLAEYEKFTRS